MKAILILTIISILTSHSFVTPCRAASTTPPTLYAQYSALYDTASGRILYGKNENTPRPCASTTKIMTCILALELAPDNLSCTASSYAVSMPEVKLYASKGETFSLRDLLYSLMLRSHNDTAVIIAENVARYHLTKNGHDISAYTDRMLCDEFVSLMNQKACELDCHNTFFVTPNGLDGTKDGHVHSSSAADLCKIMSYCITNDNFIDISSTSQITISSDLRSYHITNSNPLINSLSGMLAGKTGFTCDAGYCYVCAYRDEYRTLTVALLACGWPNNRSYRYTDTRKLIDYACKMYTPSLVLDPSDKPPAITILYGNNTKKIPIKLQLESKVFLNLSDIDNVEIIYNIDATNFNPTDVKPGLTIGYATVYINDEYILDVPIVADSDCS